MYIVVHKNSGNINPAELLEIIGDVQGGIRTLERSYLKQGHVYNRPLYGAVKKEYNINMKDVDILQLPIDQDDLIMAKLSDAFTYKVICTVPEDAYQSIKDEIDSDKEESTNVFEATVSAYNTELRARGLDKIHRISWTPEDNQRMGELERAYQQAKRHLGDVKKTIAVKFTQRVIDMGVWDTEEQVSQRDTATTETVTETVKQEEHPLLASGLFTTKK